MTVSPSTNGDLKPTTDGASVGPRMEAQVIGNEDYKVCEAFTLNHQRIGLLKSGDAIRGTAFVLRFMKVSVSLESVI